jgi:hypothetical protein
MKTVISLLATIIFFYSCNNKTDEISYIDSLCYDSSKFSIDTPQGSYYYRNIINNQYLTLKPINVPSDTFFIRIEYSSRSRLKILESSYYKSNFSFKIYSFPVDSTTGKILFNKETENINDFITVYEPSKKGKDFLSQLKLNTILDLPDCQKVNGYSTELSTNSVFIEYSNQCMYRMFFYCNPYANRQHFKEANSVSIFLEYLKGEFNF